MSATATTNVGPGGRNPVPIAGAPAGGAGSFSLDSFVLPAELEAVAPPEADGRGRDRGDVKLLTSWRREGRIAHGRFAALVDHLDPGDLLVVNDSTTVAAAVPAVLPASGGDPGSSSSSSSSAKEEALEIHLSTELPGGAWAVEVRRPAGNHSLPLVRALAGTTLELSAGGRAHILAPYPAAPAAGGGVDRHGRRTSRLWYATLELPSGLPTYLARHGRPIRYSYVQGDWPLSSYQTVFGTRPGSAEMPSASRPFTAELVTRLVAKGVGISPLTLHTGVSSLEKHEPPFAERYRVPASTASAVNRVHHDGGRVVAGGTTVVRALETVADEQGTAHPGEGWTELVISPSRPVRVVDGLLTGWHEPEASHLLMLEAITGRATLEHSYAEALAGGYRWHEFGDSNLILP